ncbi:MAG: transposase [Phycisphaerales bacterium]|nr:transposase [Phycisphaerales bacterium]
MTDANGMPLRALQTAGQESEPKQLEAMMDTVRIARRRRPVAVASDNGHSAGRLRAWCARRGIEAVIPTRREERRHPLDRRRHRRRNVVERCIGWLKCCRRIATRHE